MVCALEERAGGSRSGRGRRRGRSHHPSPGEQCQINMITVAQAPPQVEPSPSAGELGVLGETSTAGRGEGVRRRPRGRASEGRGGGQKGRGASYQNFSERVGEEDIQSQGEGANDRGRGGRGGRGAGAKKGPRGRGGGRGRGGSPAPVVVGVSRVVPDMLSSRQTLPNYHNQLDSVRMVSSQPGSSKASVPLTSSGVGILTPSTLPPTTPSTPVTPSPGLTREEGKTRSTIQFNPIWVGFARMGICPAIGPVLKTLEACCGLT